VKQLHFKRAKGEPPTPWRGSRIVAKDLQASWVSFCSRGSQGAWGGREKKRARRARVVGDTRSGGVVGGGWGVRSGGKNRRDWSSKFVGHLKKRRRFL